MAGRGQKVFYIAFDDLRDKYKSQTKQRITSMCKAIGEYTQTQIGVQGMPNRSVRFEVVGRKAKVAKDNICQEFCLRSTHDKYHVDPKKDLSSQKAQQIMLEKKQDKMMKEDIDSPYLLTEAALKKHNIITGASSLREFACGPCDRYWWSVVPITKTVSKCHRCNVKYDALPRNKEFGIGRYICQNEKCNKTFYCRCHATQMVPCFNCNIWLRTPYIHPRFIRSSRPRRPLEPEYSPPIQKKKVINPSTRHISTGSTISTFLSQMAASDIDVPMADPDSDSDEEVILGSDPESSDDEDGDTSDAVSTISDSTSGNYDADQSSTDALPSSSSSDSESEDDGSPRDHRRSEATGSSDSESTDDSDDKDIDPSEDGSDELFSQVDSGMDTASNADTRSTLESPDPVSFSGASSQLSSGKFSPLCVTEVKPDYPGIVFSKKCSQQTVDHMGTVLQGEGIKVEIPSTAIPSGDQVPVTLQACLKGPFKLPHDYTLASPVYLLYPPCVFHETIKLTADLFADLEPDCQDVVFATSPDKPHIRKKQEDAVWKFQQEQGEVQCLLDSHGNPTATVQLGHFCLGAFLIRRRRNKRNRYLISLYTPAVLSPTCHAIFSASVYHEVYTNNLETYLDKKFLSENFRDTHHYTRVIEDEIRLVIPKEKASEQGYTITPSKEPCKITKEEVDIAWKHKRLARTNIATYPPRIVLTIQHKQPGADVSCNWLTCSFQVSGLGEDNYFPLSLTPSPSLSQRTSQDDSIEAMSDSLITQSSMTFDQLIQRVDISKECLEKQCSEVHLRQIARLIPNWLKFAQSLQLTESKILEIKDDGLLDNEMRAEKVLKTWHRKHYFMASYKKLMVVCLSLDNAQLAMRICGLLNESEG